MLFHEKIWAGHPSYHFSVGDTVMIGLNEGTVTEVREDGRYYRVKYEIKTRGKGETRCGLQYDRKQSGKLHSRSKMTLDFVIQTYRFIA